MLGYDGIERDREGLGRGVTLEQRTRQGRNCDCIWRWGQRVEAEWVGVTQTEGQTNSRTGAEAGGVGWLEEEQEASRWEGVQEGQEPAH